ncbi:MAG TPA: 4Fe-4S binding protein [Candidatus Goldiibacteriota bacterium]|nr:4Fe-4S binding protein [Candidatus Goldiibacteriota bacterium]HPN63907.1 4Fe-4S binding protein [Candidatus Goldiibacteriota bacterium]HRQ44627.1 4Fe-4S binding protein [Candidatus Goldiibacteriota bacterium]
MKRDVIEINEEKCNGCGNCIPGCPEGALQVIDGKVRLVADYLCDGLGACVGECPQDALKVVKKEVEEYDERKVIENIMKHGINTVKAHMKHLRDHGQSEYIKIAEQFLKENNIKFDEESPAAAPARHHGSGGCPGSRMIDNTNRKNTASADGISAPSELRQWPVQLHLVSPAAPYFNGADVVLAADCVAFAMGSFHKDFLKGKALAIACPKLDSDLDVYVEKITAMVEQAKINTLTVVRMQVPCCGGLVQIAKTAVEKASRKVPIKAVTVSLEGDVLEEQWI